jgi:hypothetical protein
LFSIPFITKYEKKTQNNAGVEVIGFGETAAPAIAHTTVTK